MAWNGRDDIAAKACKTVARRGRAASPWAALWIILLAGLLPAMAGSAQPCSGVRCAAALALSASDQHKADSAHANQVGTGQAQLDQAQPDQAKDLPWTPRPGDVVGNAALGVRRESTSTPSRDIRSAVLGVRREASASIQTQTSFSAVLGVTRGPVIDAIEPNQLAIGVAQQSVLIRGRGLPDNASVTVDPAEGLSLSVESRAADGSSLSLRVDVAAEAQAGLRKLRVLNALGQVIPANSLEAQALLLSTDLPLIESVTPSRVAQGSVVDLLFRGQHLKALPEPGRQLLQDTRLLIEPADGLRWDAMATINEAGTEARVRIEVSADAALGERLLQLQTASGISSASLQPANTLHVISAPLRDLSPFVAAPLGVQRGTPASPERLFASARVGIARGPVITAMTPTALTLGERRVLRLVGRELGAAQAVSLLPADGLSIVDGSFSVSAHEVSVEIEVSAQASLLPRRVQLQMPDQVLRSPSLLEIRGALPEVTAITPNVLVRDNQNQTLELQGRHFSQVSAVRLLPDSGLIVEPLQIIDDSHARVTLRAATDAARGLRVLQLRSSAGDSASEVQAGNTVQVIDRAEWLTPVVSPLLGVRRDSATIPPAQTLWSGTLGVQRGPFAHSLQPASVPRGTSLNLIVSGQGLQSVDAVQIEPEAGVSVALGEVQPEGQQLQIAITIAADATPGARRLRLLAGSQVIRFVPDSAGLLQVLQTAAGGPLAMEDRYTLQANRSFTVDAADGVLINDINNEGGDMFAVLRSVPAQGVLNLRSDGSFTYTPADDFVGTATFQYSAGNASAVGVAARVNLQVVELHSPRDDNYVARDNQNLVVPASEGLLANDLIGDGPAPSIELAQQPSLGTLSLQVDGGFTYNPNLAGSEQFSYRLRTADSVSHPAVVRIETAAVNVAPVAADDQYSLSRGARLDVSATQGVLANDSDANGDPITAVLRTAPAVGVLNLAANGSFSYTPPSDFVGEASFVYEARDPRGLAGVGTARLTVNDIDLPTAPILVAPVDGSTVYQSQLAVSGMAQAGSQVQLYLDDLPVGGLLVATPAGNFAGAVTLPGEGTHRLSADARNPRGSSPRSAETWITYSSSVPQLSVLSPAQGALIQIDSDINVAVVDPAGVQRVEFRVDGELKASLTQAPWTWHWQIAELDDGEHLVAISAFNVLGHSASVDWPLTVQKLPPPPPPVPTPYVGVLDSIDPAVTWGETPVRIRGHAQQRDSTDPTPNSLLKLVLEVNGFERRINLATDAAGAFDFAFQPDATDVGHYRVSVRHPDQADPSWQGEFSVDRVRFQPSQINLAAARTVLNSLQVTATATSGALSNLRLQAVAADQPTGSLPSGLQLQLPSPINLADGASRTLSIGFTADHSTPESGTVVLTAFADQSAGTPRARISIHYRLSNPEPRLVAQPRSLQAGVAQGGQVSVSAEVINQGLLAAEAVQVTLLNSAGNGPAPDWVSLGSLAQIGQIDVGARAAVQVTATPGTTVADGVYMVRARVTAANASAGDIPVQFSVTQAGEGDLRFHASDPYTSTVDESGQPIPGLANARVRLQHETIPNLIREGHTDAAGNLLIEDLPVGHYIWRVSAPNHADSSGSVAVQPGVEVPVDAFVDLELVSIEWQVTETTIPDQYDIVVDATYHTEVPAPVVVMEPVFVNLPAMQQGEEYSGELSISNYGLVRADHLRFIPAPSDGYYQFEFLGEVPTELAARERIRVAYRITALQALPQGQVALAGKGDQLAKALEALRSNTFGIRLNKDGASCSNYRNVASLGYDYECANGAVRNGSATTTWGRTIGGGCGSPGGTSVHICHTSDNHCGGNDGGGWGGGGGSTPMSDSPGCTPNCKKCCSKGGAGGGGSGSGSGSGAGSGAGTGFGGGAGPGFDFGG